MQVLARKPLTNPKNVRICVNAKAPSTYAAMYTETVTLPDGSMIRREWTPVPARAARRKAPKQKKSARKPAKKLKQSPKAKLSAKKKRAR